VAQFLQKLDCKQLRAGVARSRAPASRGVPSQPVWPFGSTWRGRRAAR